MKLGRQGATARSSWNWLPATIINSERNSNLVGKPESRCKNLHKLSNNSTPISFPRLESTPLTNGRLRLQVSVHDLVRVEVLQPADQLMNRSIARMHSEPTALVVACALALLLMTATQGTCHLQACLDTARSLTQCLPPTKRQHVHAKVSSDGNVFPGCAWTKKCLDICSLNLRPLLSPAHNKHICQASCSVPARLNDSIRGTYDMLCGTITTHRQGGKRHKHCLRNSPSACSRSSYTHDRKGPEKLIQLPFRAVLQE